MQIVIFVKLKFLKYRKHFEDLYKNILKIFFDF